MPLPSPAAYSRSLIVIHWATLALMVLSFVTHEGMKDAIEALSRGREAGGAALLGLGLHLASGALVLALTVLCLVLRAVQGHPGPVPGQSPLAARVAGAVHGLIYVLLFALTLSGVAAWFDLGPEPGDLHETVFQVMLLVIALHAGAALFHHFALRDGVMARMAPGRIRSRRG